MTSRARSVTSAALAGLGVLLCLVSLVAVWSRNQVLDTDRYLKSVVPLAGDPVIQDEVSTKVAAAINARLDAEDLARNALPRRARGLAPALAGATESFVDSTTSTFVHSDAFVTLWTELNRTGHQELVTVLTGDDDQAVEISGGRLRLDLGRVVTAVRDRLAAAGLTVVSRMPPITLVVDVADADGVQKARQSVKILDKVATWLPILAILLLAGAVALSRRRLRTAYLACLGVVAAMLVAHGLISLGSHVAVDHVPATAASAAAVRAYYAHLTSLLQDGAVLVGLVFALLGLVAAAGPVVLRLAGGTKAAEVDRGTWRTLGVRTGVLVVVAVLLVTAPPFGIAVVVLLALLVAVVLLRRAARPPAAVA